MNLFFVKLVFYLVNFDMLMMNFEYVGWDIKEMLSFKSLENLKIYFIKKKFINGCDM